LFFQQELADSFSYVPVWWAKKNIPDAYFAFFHKDKEVDESKMH
jgi:hypothetical protein